jgi:signal transduction histidine kinase
MVHDVRTPLAILNMLAYTLEQSVGASQEVQEQLAILKEEIPKIEKIVTEYREEIRPFFKKN